MCGIIGTFHTGKNKEPVNDAVLNQFEDQKERGVNGFGIIKINDKMEFKVDRATEGYKFMYDMHSDAVRGMIIHHRIPTSSDNKIAQTHPIAVKNGSLKYEYLVVHNGVINNDDELKEEHEKLGFVYTTVDKSGAYERFNDSECVAIEVARFIEQQVDQVGTRGSCAFICIQINPATEKKPAKVNKIFFGRNEGNPLNMAKTRNKLMLSSTGPGDEVKPFTLYECNLDDAMALTKRKMTFAPDLVRTIPPSLWEKDNNCRLLPKTSNVDWGKYYDSSNRVKGSIYGAEDDDIPTGIPTEDDDEEGSCQEIVDAIEDNTEAITLEVDQFVDLLYDPLTAENINETDIEITIDVIRKELEMVVAKAQRIHADQALAADEAAAEEAKEKTMNEIGFTTG